MADQKICIGRNVAQYRAQLKTFAENHQINRGVATGLEALGTDEVQVEVCDNTLETVKEGDWVIEGLHGELFTCSDGFVNGLVIPFLVNTDIEYI